MCGDFYSTLTCGLEVTATKAAQGRGRGWGSSIRGNRAGVSLGLRSRVDSQLLSTSCVSLDSDIISLSLSSPNCNMRILVVATWRNTSENGEGATLCRAYQGTQQEFLYPLSLLRKELVLFQLQLTSCFSNHWVHDCYVLTLGWLEINR